MQFPGAALPFGMVKLSPDNRDTGWKAGHDYRIKNIAGFNFVHDYHITGFYVMPVCGDFETDPGSEKDPDSGYRSRICNETEQASPGYYSVMLDDYGIKAEVSALPGIVPKRQRLVIDIELPRSKPATSV
jgi:putative alpha-1,2-mannosidase